MCGGHDPRVEEITSPAIAIPASRRCWTFRDGGWSRSIAPLSMGSYHDSAKLRNPYGEILIMPRLQNRMLAKRFEFDSIHLSPAANTWTELPGLRTPVSYASAAALDGLLYVSGGQGTDGGKRRSVQVMDTSTFTWHLGPPLPAPVWGHCMATSTAGKRDRFRENK